MARRHLWIVAGLVLIAAFGILSIARTLRRPNAIARLNDEVRDLRTAADSCMNTVTEGEAELHRFNARLDTLRGRVRGLEALDPRGVPADSYPIYMQAFEQYNDSAGGWDERVDSLQASLARCRTITEEHNLTIDSLRTLIIEQRRRR